ncbi:MAG: AMP-binding protein, partial [Holophagae bacterium]|nr:AMP-binding protein [Holophagae bacterium]
GATISLPGKRAKVLFAHGPDLANEGIARTVPESNGNAVAVVSCGKPLRGTKIKIIDMEGNPLSDCHVGEIAIQSMSMFSEYAGDELLTEHALVDGWFHTGDLGFMMGDELFFAGRLKDIIIVGGRNISPVELEKAAAEIPGLFPGQVVAFGVADEFLGTERVVLVCAVRGGERVGTRADMARAIRQHLAKKTGVAISDVKLVRKGWIEKTANGKLSRSKNRKKYLVYGGVKENG